MYSKCKYCGVTIRKESKRNTRWVHICGPYEGDTWSCHNLLMTKATPILEKINIEKDRCYDLRTNKM